MLARARESREAELATLGPHAGQVRYALFSPDGARVLTCGQDAAVHLWDAATGRELHVLRGHAPPVLAAWSPSGEVATADASGMIRLWTPDGRLRTAIPGARSVAKGVAITSDGAHFGVARDDGSIEIGDTRSGTPYATWKGDPDRIALAFDPAGTRALAPGESGTVVVWSIEGRALARLEGHTRPVWQAVFDPTGARVITASLDKTARIWDSRTGQTIHRLVGHEDRVTYVAVDAHARRVATASADTTVRIWSLDTGDAVATLRGHTAQVNAVVFASDDQLVSASNDGTVRVWDLIHNIQTAAYHHGGPLWHVSLDPGARRLATASWSGTAKIWDLQRQSRLQTYASPVARPGEEGARSIRAVMTATRLARIGTRGIAVWDLTSSDRWTWKARDLVEGALSPDGRLAVAVDEGGDLHVLDAYGNLLRRFPGPGRGVVCVAVYPDGRRAVTCGPEGTIAIWELATGRRLAMRRVGAVNWITLSSDGGAMIAFKFSNQTEGKAVGWLLAGDLSREIRLEHDASLTDATFSPDGARLATLSNDGAVRIWNRDGGLEALLHHTGPALRVAWSSDGSWLATGTAAGTLTIWDRPTWRVRKALEAHVNFINALAIDERDTLIATAGGDGIVKLWDVETFLQVARIPAGPAVSHLAVERGRLWVSGPFATQVWRCDRYDRP